MTTTEVAPFTITIHNEPNSWHETSVLLALINQTVVITTREGYIFDGEVRSLDETSLTITNDNVHNSWTEMTIVLANITNIHYS